MGLTETEECADKSRYATISTDATKTKTLKSRKKKQIDRLGEIIKCAKLLPNSIAGSFEWRRSTARETLAVSDDDHHGAGIPSRLRIGEREYIVRYRRFRNLHVHMRYYIYLVWDVRHPCAAPVRLCVGSSIKYASGGRGSLESMIKPWIEILKKISDLI